MNEERKDDVRYLFGGNNNVDSDSSQYNGGSNMNGLKRASGMVRTRLLEYRLDRRRTDYAEMSDRIRERERVRIKNLIKDLKRAKKDLSKYPDLSGRIGLMLFTAEQADGLLSYGFPDTELTDFELRKLAKQR